MNKESSNFMSGSSSWCVMTLPTLVDIGIVAVDMFLVCHVIKEDHINKGSGDYDLKVVHLPVKLAANRHCNSRYIIALVCHVI